MTPAGVAFEAELPFEGAAERSGVIWRSGLKNPVPGGSGSPFPASRRPSWAGTASELRPWQSLSPVRTCPGPL
jgi:hypothetical protein